jgi:predicted GH43/DUF377 family glycosyl hydrolase
VNLEHGAGGQRDLGTRVGDRPLITKADIPPIAPGFEVQAVLNPAAARLGEETVLLLRVAERARGDIDPPGDARTLDFSGPHPKIVPLPAGYTKDEVVPIAMRDPDAPSFTYVPIYLPKDLPGLDLRDPRGVSFTHPALGKTVTFLAQASHLRCAWSKDGVHFRVDEAPAIAASTDLEEYGCEDARATHIDGIWYITYTAVSRVGVTPSLALTRDFKTFDKRGALLLPDEKDLALFPVKRDGQFLALTRPMPSSFGHVLGIWIATPDQARPWGSHQPLVLPREGMWDERQTGAGCVPFLTSAGWLEIYHGADATLTYALGAVLLDRDDPTKVLGRSVEPILRPTAPYERSGLLSNVVFTCGHVALDDGPERIRVYYGAADSTIAAAEFSVREILDSLGPPDPYFGHG